MSSALSALLTNTGALRVVSNNISNVNTPDYARRQVDLQTVNAGGQVAGVEIGDIKRVVDQFLQQESLSATSSSSLYDAQSTTYDQISALLGSPGDGTALTSKLSNIFAALGQAALSPSTPSSQNNVVGSMRSLANTVSSLSSSLSSLSSQIDNQLVTAVGTVNSLIKQIYDLNMQIKSATAQGQTDTSYLDQRDSAIRALSQQIDVRTTTQPDGTLQVTTQDGVGLVSTTYAQLSYAPATSNVSQAIQVQETDPRTQAPIGTARSLDQHLSGGSIKGLIDMRDGTIADLKNELGAFAQGVALSFNQVHNTNSAFPPPQSLSGHQTGLLSTDSLNFSGKTTITTTDTSGVLTHSIAVDFSAGTISVDGGAATSFNNTIGDFVAKLNTAMGSCGGSADFTDGRLTLNASANGGVVVSDKDASNPSSRGGTAFSQFFGLNDLFQTSTPSILATGVSGSDVWDPSASGNIKFALKGPNGDVALNTTVNVTAGMTFSQVITAVNTALSGYGSLALNSDGSVSTTISSAFKGYKLEVASDTTSRGSTGISLTNLFGIGADQISRQASGFSLVPKIDSDPSLIALAKPDFSTSQIVGAGDSNGLLALQNLATSQQSFTKAGSLGTQVTTLVNYASALYQDFATRTASAQTNKQTQDERLNEAQSRFTSNSGVSLDEELSNMMTYQQAYNAGARMLTMVGQLYDTLLQIV
jgi:flagellar hook-associated protein 1 FlgK